MRPTQRVRELLQMSTDPWPKNKAAIAKLSNGELALAEKFERLGKRRRNKLMALKAERQRRAGRGEKMMRLQVESNL